MTSVVSDPKSTSPSQPGAREALAEWLERANNLQLPVFSATVREVTSIAGSSRSSAKDLAEAIGRDAALTAKLLRTASSPLFGQRERSLRSINQAVVLLGFDAVRDLAISLSLIDKIARSEGATPIIQELLRAFHGAAQARAIAAEQRQPLPEESFLAALLSRLGELIFWASGSDETQALKAARAEHGRQPDDERLILGFELKELTRELVRQWQLSELLKASLDEPSEIPKVAGVQLANELANATNPALWESLDVDSFRDHEAVANLVGQRAELLKQKPEEAFLAMRTQAEQTVKLAQRFGVPESHWQVAAVEEQPAAASDSLSDVNDINPGRQVEVLTAITSALQGPVTLDQLMALALEGIVDGGGFDRTFFALLSPDRKELRMKHKRGAVEELPTMLELTSNPTLKDALPHVGVQLLTAPITLRGTCSWQSPEQAVLHTVNANGTPIGMIYADRGLRGPQITDPALAVFGLFVQQVLLGLAGPLSR